MPANPIKRRKAKSDRAGASDAAGRHERAKDCLSPGEVAKLLDAAKAGRHRVRDNLLLMTYRHGLRASKAVGLRRDGLDLGRARLWVRRLKGGLSVEQPVAGGELRAIKRRLAARTDALPWLFVSERSEIAHAARACQPLTRQAAKRAGLPGVHPRMLRHSCGFALADKGHDLRLSQGDLGHRDPRHTVHYTRTAGQRFEGLWR